jgi:hypothetical protein
VVDTVTARPLRVIIQLLMCFRKTIKFEWMRGVHTVLHGNDIGATDVTVVALCIIFTLFEKDTLIF